MDSLMSPAEAFAAIALAAVACDGSVDHHEAALLRGMLEGRHPYQGRSEETMGLLFEGLLDQLQAAGWQALISRAITALNACQRETALAMAAHLIHGDRQVSAEERHLLDELATQMGLPDGRAEQILEVIAVLHRDSLLPGPDAPGPERGPQR
ncbi:MAG: tellurite resistance TerB family protein [Cyanobacteriota bacterium]|nr:tellurite resistance TerB family protein [Cyanobacteriota bacterium]